MVISINPNLRVRLIFVWASAILATILFAFVWFVMGLFIAPVIDLVVAAYDFQPPYDSIVSLSRNTLLYFPILMALGLIVWGAMNSSRHQKTVLEDY